MAKKKASKSVSITFYYDKELGYSWYLNDENAEGITGGGGGFKSIINVAFDYDFLKVLKKYLGKSSVDNNMLELAKKKAEEQKRNAIPFTDEMVGKIEAGLGMKIKRVKK